MDRQPVKKGERPLFSPLGFAVFLWLAAAIAAYYIYHKPLEPAAGLHLLRIVLQVGCALGLTAAAGGLGRRLFPLDDFPPLTTAALQAGLGFGLLGLLVLFGGTIFGVSAWGAWLLLLVLLTLLRQQAADWLKSWRLIPRMISDGGQFGQLIAAGLGLTVFWALLTALAPPLRWDSLNYHLALPQQYFEAGRVAFLPGNIFSGMPQGGEILYTWAVSLAGIETAALLGLIFGILAVAGIADFAATCFTARAGLVAAAVLLTGYTLSSSLAWGYVDWLAALFGLGVFVFLDQWTVQGERRLLLLAGVFAGFALGTKYTAGVVVVAGIVLILVARIPAPASIRGPRSKEGATLQPGNNARPGPDSGTSVPVSWLKRTLSHLLSFLAALTLTILPWLVKNLLTTGNPVFPFFLPSDFMSPLRQAFLQEQLPQGGWENALLLPWQAVITGIDEIQGFGASLGPLLLALGALSWLGGQTNNEMRRTTVQNAWIFSLTGLAVWALAGRLSGLLIQSRLYLVIFPALALLAAAGFYGLERFHWTGVRLGRIARVSVLLVLLLNLVELTGAAVYRQVPQQVLGLETPEAYLVHNLGDYALAMQALEGLPAGSRVRLLWEARSVYCRADCEPDEVLDEWVVSARKNGYSVPAILNAWRAQGFTHVLIFNYGADLIRSDTRYLPEDWQSFDRLLENLELVQDFNAIYRLYRIP